MQKLRCYYYDYVCIVAPCDESVMCLQAWYCPEKKSIDKFNVPPSFQLLSEIGEATASILDSKVCVCFVTALN